MIKPSEFLDWSVEVLPDNEEIAMVTFTHRCGWFATLDSETKGYTLAHVVAQLDHECAS